MFLVKYVLRSMRTSDKLTSAASFIQLPRGVMPARWVIPLLEVTDVPTN